MGFPARPPSKHPRPPSHTANLRDLVEKFTDPAREHQASIRWDSPDFTIDADPRWALPPSDPLGATRWYRHQPLETRVKIATRHWASEAHGAIECEEMLIDGLLELSKSSFLTRDERTCLRTIIGDERSHIAMFTELERRLGVEGTGISRKYGRLFGALHRNGMRWAARFVPGVFLLLASLGELEIVLSHRGEQRHQDHPLLKQILRTHTRDEILHVEFARDFLRHHAPRFGRVQRLAMAIAAPITMAAMGTNLLRVSEPVVRAYDVPNDVLHRAYDINVVHQRRLSKVFYEGRKFCQDVGLSSTSINLLWKALGVWRRQPVQARRCYRKLLRLDAEEVAVKPILVPTGEDGDNSAVTHAFCMVPKKAPPSRTVILHSAHGHTVPIDSDLVVALLGRGWAVVQIEPYGHGLFSSSYDAAHPSTQHADSMTKAAQFIYDGGLSPFFESFPDLADRPIHQIGFSMGGGTVVHYNTTQDPRIVVEGGRTLAVSSTVLINPRIKLNHRVLRYSWSIEKLVAPAFSGLLRLSRGKLDGLLRRLLPMPRFTSVVESDPLMTAEERLRRRREMLRLRDQGHRPTHVDPAYGSTVFRYDEQLVREIHAGDRSLGVPTFWLLCPRDEEIDAASTAGCAALLSARNRDRWMEVPHHNPFFPSNLSTVLDAIQAFFEEREHPSMRTVGSNLMEIVTALGTSG